MSKWIQARYKAVTAFVVAFVGSLVTITQSGSVFGPKTLLLALGMSVVTSYGVHQTKNQQ